MSKNHIYGYSCWGSNDVRFDGFCESTNCVYVATQIANEYSSLNELFIIISYKGKSIYFVKVSRGKFVESFYI